MKKLILLIQQIKQSLKKRFDLYKRILVVTIILILFTGNYHICNYYYPLETEEHIRSWWIMKMDIYALIVCLCFVLASFKSTDNLKLIRIEKFITSVGIGLALSNYIDRHFYGIESYIATDLMTVIAILLVSYYDFNKLKKIAKTHSGNER